MRSVRMRGWLMVLLAAMGMPVAQGQGAPEARANVTAYYDEAAIEKQAYRESPYYQELAGRWEQRRTDSSIVYSRQLEADKSWRDYHVYLNVRAGRTLHVSLNGKPVGDGDDSRHWNEFLLDRGLKYGKPNTLAIEAVDGGQGALLEDTALRVGLNGEPFLRFKTDPNISDMTLVGDYDAATGGGSISLSANVFCGKRKGKYYVEVVLWDPRGHEFDKLGRWVVFGGKSDESVELNRAWARVEPWSAESPSLYTAVVRLRNEKMEEEELVGMCFGFRHVEVKEGVLTLNGKALTLNGVAYGLEHTEGHASRERMRQDVLAMKRCNINAVRTARFSPMDPYFYELCDRYGLYVVCDANLLPLSEQHRAVATDPDFIPLFQRRVGHLYGSLKNHPSIIVWSLGDTRDNGVCMLAAYRHLKQLDATRPVLFSGADHGEATDIIAPSHPTLAQLRQMLEKQAPRPYLMAYAADGGHFADLEGLWQLVEGQRQLQGGFVDLWPLPQAMQPELKHLFSPMGIGLSKFTPDEGEFLVHNRQVFSGLGAYTLEYNIYSSLRPSITGGDLPLAVAGGGSEKVSMRLPAVETQAGEEMFIQFVLRHRSGELPPWQQGGAPVVDAVTFALPWKSQAEMPLKNVGPVEEADTALAVLRPRLRFLGHEDWQVRVVDQVERRPDEATRSVDCLLSYTDGGGATMCDVRMTYTLFASGDAVADYSLAPAERVRGQLVPVVSLDYGADSVVWYGLDREVFFPTRHSGVVGIHRRPVSSFARGQVRWCALARAGEPDLFVRLIGRQALMTVAPGGVGLQPEGGDMGGFRLHLSRRADASPLELLSTEMPRTVADILEPPTITASAPRFTAPMTITLASPSEGEIHYTLDGSEPTEASATYRGPFEIAATTVVKARVCRQGMPPSFVASRKFNYDYIVGTSFSRKANTPYNAGADTLLFDGEKGQADDLSHGWVGFSGAAVTTTVELARPLAVDYVTLRFAHHPALWVFAPREVQLLLSADGQSFADTLRATIPFDPADEANGAPQVVELQMPVGRQGVTQLRIVPLTVEAIPAWHRGKGLKPWMMMDEIQVSETIE